MGIRRSWKAVVGVLEGLVKWTAYTAAIVTAIGYFTTVFKWGFGGPFGFIASHLALLWSVAVSASIILLWIWSTRLRARFTVGFKEDFRGGDDPRRKWDFVGPWEVNDGALVVTGSDQGGITKTGALWENYTLTFEAKILKNCLGVIVRAQGLDNYYMFQLNKTRIRPHRRVAVPSITTQAPSSGDSSGKQTHPVVYTTGWQLFDEFCVDLDKPLDQWFRTRVSVRGEAIEIHIDEQPVWQHGAFLKIATGKIGFRNHGPERALVRNIRVKLDP